LVLELALAKERGEDSLAALATMFVGRAMIDGSAAGAESRDSVRETGQRTPDFDHPALGADEGFRFSRFAERRATNQERYGADA
jgi:hypothetical protein